MKTQKKRASQRTGTVTALLLLFAVILSLLGAATMRLGMHERRSATHSANIVKAKTAADAGLALAVHRFKSMIASQSVDLSLLDLTGEPIPNSDATFDSTVNTGALNTYQIEVTGHSQNVTRTVHATLELKGLFHNVISVKNELYLAPGSTISEINSMDPFDTDLEVTMGTASIAAGMVPMGPGTVINGDVFVGVGGNPATVISGSGTITGDQYALEEAMVFPVITPPSFGMTEPSIIINGTSRTLTPLDNGRYSGLSLSRQGATPGELYIDGDVVLHITGDFDLGMRCETKINPGSSLILYLDGDYLSGVDSFIENKTNDPRALQVFATGTGPQLFQFKPNVETFGLIYAPNSTVEVSPLANLKGAFVAYDFKLLTNGVFTYDKALQAVGLNDVGVRLELDRWSE